ncbi:MAG: hypothetical protein QME14_09555 [Methanobacteriaceae archaeon]|nr:hypothetical protein [Methanobacteriaceae archaeon]
MWLENFDYDPIKPLISCGNFAIEYFTKRDLLDERVPSVKTLWKEKTPQKIIHKQQKDGSWRYPGGYKQVRSTENYNQLETFRQLGVLVEKYGLNQNHASIKKTGEFLFKFQTDEGDIRGIYGNQYATTYSSAIMELLIKVGYHDDPRIEKGFQWLLANSQEDGGWAIPFRTIRMTYSDSLKLQKPLKGDSRKPFSHLITGMALRAFASHPHYRKSPKAQHAGKLLMGRFFKRDKYNDRQDKNYWESVSYPFWFTNIVTSLDSLYYLGFDFSEPQIQLGLNWLVEIQIKDGTFDLKLLMTRDKDLKFWITLAICRIFKRYYHNL